MKKVLIGVGLGLAAASQAQAWDGGIEDMRTMEANEAGPVVRIKSVRVDGWHGGKYHTSAATYRCSPDGRCHDGWRRLKGTAHTQGNGSYYHYGSHARTTQVQVRSGYQQHTAQQTRAQRQAYYAAQAQRKARLLAQKRHAAQVAAQQRQQALQKQRVLAAQRKAAAIQKQRLLQQQRLIAQRKAIALQQQRLAAQRQAAQQRRIAVQRQAAAHQQITPRRVAPLPVHYPMQEYQYVEVQPQVYQPVQASQMVSQMSSPCPGGSQMTSCSGGYQRAATVNTHRVRTISKQRTITCPS